MSVGVRHAAARVLQRTAPERVNTVSLRVVLFDADGVLQSMGPLAEYLSGRFGWSDDMAAAFLHDYWGRESACGCLEGRTYFAGVFEALLRDWEVTVDPADFYQDFLTAAIAPEHDVLALVAQVRAAGIRCGLATNQETGRARFMAVTLGYGRVFDHLFFSCEVGCAKPSQEYFSAILETLGLPAGEVLFMDDRPVNVEAAEAAGLCAELVIVADDVRSILTNHGLIS